MQSRGVLRGYDMKRANVVCLTTLVLVTLLACGGVGSYTEKDTGTKGITPEAYLADRPTGKYDDQVVTVSGSCFWMDAASCTEDHHAFCHIPGLNINQRRDSAEGKQLFEILKDGAPHHKLTVDLSARDTDGVLLPLNHARVVKIH